MADISANERLLLISNSTVYGRGYLDHAEEQIRELIPEKSRLLFVPFALQDRRAYATRALERLGQMGYSLTSVHDVSNMPRAIVTADAIFVGGGNTFRLLKALYDHNLIEPIRNSVAGGTPYIGSSAGAIVAGPSLKTTKDMPVVQPPSFDALGLVPFQISPHYLDPDPSSKHMGETQEERILQFLEENEAPVVGLREGSMLRVDGATINIIGPHTARIFRRDQPIIEASSGYDLSEALHCSKSPTVGVAA